MPHLRVQTDSQPLIPTTVFDCQIWISARVSELLRKVLNRRAPPFRLDKYLPQSEAVDN